MVGVSPRESYEKILDQIERAAKKSNRNSEEITLLAVSKKQSIEKIRALQSLGHVHFGENYVQEWQEKSEQIKDIQWHFIGALQKNKAKFLVGKVEMIQSVDRSSLLDTIDRLASERKVRQKILLQVNIGEEESKAGILPSEFEELLHQAKIKENIQICGLMSLPPLSSDESVVRENFQKCKSLFEKMRKELGDSVIVLSMGTTSDFELAIEEGATQIRVGTALFGLRD